MKFSITIFIFGLFFFTNNVFSQNKKQTSVESARIQSSEVTDLIERFNKPENISILSGALWTATHDYTDLKHSQEILQDFQSYLVGFEKYKDGDSKPLEKLGGVEKFKNKLTEWLKHKDQSVRAFAAVVIGITGDKSLAPKLAELLEKRPGENEPLIVYDRGRSAMSLGMLGAKEYLPKILPLLQSKNQFDRQGAISALTYLNAKEYSKQIASILTDKEFQFDDDASPIFFLIETNTAKNHKKELIQVMLGEFRSETREAAMYALVRLDAKETAPHIAKLLKDQFKKGDAAKALSLLGAKDYSSQIALLLNDEKGLVKSDAALALGVLKAKNYAAEVAKLLNDKETFVHNYAAASLLLMEAKEYYNQALPIVDKPFSENAFLTDTAFHPLVKDQSRRISEDLKKIFFEAKSAK